MSLNRRTPPAPLEDRRNVRAVRHNRHGDIIRCDDNRKAAKSGEISMKLRIVCIICLSLVISISKSSAATVWLDDLNVSVTSQGWGQPHKSQSVDGHSLTIGGKSFKRGLGTHAESTLFVKLDGRARSFLASVGVDDEVTNNPAASVEFFVIGDGKELWRSGVMRGGDTARDCVVDVSGVKSLLLKVGDAGDGIAFDHADWADAKFETAGAMTFAVSGSPV